MPDKIKFGTDGWRGVIAEDYTFDNVRRAAQVGRSRISAIPPPETSPCTA